MICYIDSSVVLRNILGSDGAYNDFSQFKKVGSSEILSIECNRVLDRYRLEKILSDEQISKAKFELNQTIEGLYFIEISEKIKQRAASAFPTIIGTLDAIHLSSAILWRETEKTEKMFIATHDKQMTACAIALNFTIIGN
ncbi:MAG TPA: hypothetical protein PK926_02800 [Spirochaetota bacterium]|nr:hypothetical protein [Spirochaetota bacterium]HPI87991.1 hypothetical protein [Spirochaetota bacterium]HPR46702.1 hypothetical protein [Spirochaetota bacterium]